jgi:hypothetical protein
MGKSYFDVRGSVTAGKAEIQAAIRQGERDIATARQSIDGLGNEVKMLKSDIAHYQRVNADIGKLQEQLKTVQGEVVDLGQRPLRAKSFEGTSNEPGSWSMGRTGCPPSTLAKGHLVAYCVEGSPLTLHQLTPSGELRPVASLSSIGFQDASVGPKPSCNMSSRGTFYVEKGSGDAPDRPFLCSRQSGGSYGWIQLAVVR